MFPAFLGKLHWRYRTLVGALTVLAVDFAVVITIYTVFHVNLGAFIKWPSVVFLVLYAIAMVYPLILGMAVWLMSRIQTSRPVSGNHQDRHR